MKPKLFFALFCAVIMFASCKKSSTDTSVIKKQVKVPVKITWISSNGNFNYTKLITYDDKGRISAIQQGDYTKRYTYSGSDLVNITNYYRNYADDVLDITYTNGLPATLVLKNSSNRTYTYTVVNNKIESRTSQNETFWFTYAGNNITKSTEPYNISNTFKFSALKSAFYNARLKFVFTAIGYEYGDDDYFSENAVSQFNSGGQAIVQSTYTYTADADGFPASAVVQSIYRGSGQTVTANVTYEYQIREFDN